MPLPYDNLAYPVFIQIGDEFGTGFNLATEYGEFFISAKHVFYKKDGTLKNNTALLKFRVQNPSEKDYSINIHEINIDQLLEEKRIILSPDKDIIIFDFDSVKLNPKTGIKDQIHFFKLSGSNNGRYTRIPKNSPLTLDQVAISNDIYIFGYPNSIGMISDPQFNYNVPLIRKGIVSQVNRDSGTIILDCQVHGGNSGGPVIQINQIDSTTFNLHLIGILIQYIPYYTKQSVSYPNTYYNSTPASVIDSKNSGYSVAVSIEFALEIIKAYSENNN